MISLMREEAGKMDTKFGTILDDKTLGHLRNYCQKTHRPIRQVVKEALSVYLERQNTTAGESALTNVETSFGAMKISPRSLRVVLEEDLHETD